MHKKPILSGMLAPYTSPKHVVVAMSQTTGGIECSSTKIEEPVFPPEDLIFEIGSITKVFTSLLACVLAEEGKLDISAPLSELSADLSHVPEWITPLTLMSHTSGLPRIHVPLWKAILRPLPKDPYADFSRTDLIAWFHDQGEIKKPKQLSHWYSNFGFGLLGEALSMSEGKPYLELMNTHVIEPLGLRDTGIELSAEQGERFMHPRNTKGEKAVAWGWQAMAGAGGLRSTARDLTQLAKRMIASQETSETVLDRALARSTGGILNVTPRNKKNLTEQCHGWLRFQPAFQSPKMFYHDGGTAGSTCSLYVCPEAKASLVILSNNGIGANIWTSAKLNWANHPPKAHAFLTKA